MTSPLFVRERGQGAETVVLLHGFGGCHSVWDGTAAALADTARTLAYDLPGHGASLDFPDAGSTRKAAQAVAADIAARGLRRVHLAGHSMGGAMAIMAALAVPGRIASLTLLSPGGIGPEIDGPLLRRYAIAGDGDELAACLAAMSGPEAATPADAIAALLATRSLPGQTGRLAEIARRITRDDRQGVIPTDMLDALSMPVLVLWGTGDPVLPASQAERLPARFSVRLLPGAGHMLIEEAADAVVAAIRSNIAAAAS